MADTSTDAFSSYGTNPGGTYYAPVTPVRRSPRLRWSTATEGQQVYCHGQLVVTLGRRLALLDLASGQPLAKYKRLPRPGGGYALLTPDTLYFEAEPEGMLSLDLASGARSGPHVLGEQGGLYLVPGLALWNLRDKTTAWSLTPGQIPKQLWEHAGEERDFNGVYFAAGLVLGSVRLGGTVALDAATGAVRWRSKDQVSMADAHGTAAVGQGAGYGMLDASGARAWWRNDPKWVVNILGPSWVVTNQSGGFEPGARTTVRLHDRATGKELRALGSIEGSQLICTAASDVIYAVDERSALVAWDLEGRELWRFRIPRNTSDINYLVATEGALLGVTSSSRVFCIEEG